MIVILHSYGLTKSANTATQISKIQAWLKIEYSDGVVVDVP
jgi:hypothetical protein